MTCDEGLPSVVLKERRLQVRSKPNSFRGVTTMMRRMMLVAAAVAVCLMMMETSAEAGRRRRCCRVKRTRVRCCAPAPSCCAPAPTCCPTTSCEAPCPTSCGAPCPTGCTSTCAPQATCVSATCTSCPTQTCGFTSSCGSACAPCGGEVITPATDDGGAAPTPAEDAPAPPEEEPKA